ncbi:hypothetical protein EJ110_NYTH33108 [Nymphaea thermarum]|nr:hypothetical protein EJ110_NYTH33108 [Nymphaea thermarum]
MECIQREGSFTRNRRGYSSIRTARDGRADLWFRSLVGQPFPSISHFCRFIEKPSSAYRNFATILKRNLRLLQLLSYRVTDTGQPSTWPRAATDVAESSRQGRKRAARHLDRDEPSSIDPGAGQGDGEGGVLQLGSAGVRQLGVVTEGGAGGSATALREAMEFQGGGSSSSVFKPTQAMFEPEPAGLVTGGHQSALASSGRLCHYSGQLSDEHTSWSRASPACYLELLGITGGLNLSPAHFLDVPSLPAISGDLRPPLPFSGDCCYFSGDFSGEGPAASPQLPVLSSGILGVGTAVGVADLSGARRDPTNLVSKPPWSLVHLPAATLEQNSDSASFEELCRADLICDMDLRSGRTTMPGRMDIVSASPQVEANPSMAGEVPSTELETQAVGRMVQLESEVLMLRQEINEHTQQLSKLDELKEIKEILRAMNANQVANPRPAPAPPSQAGPNRPQLGWNLEHFEDYQGTNGGHNGQHVDPTVNIGFGLVATIMGIMVIMEDNNTPHLDLGTVRHTAPKQVSMGQDFLELSGRMLTLSVDFDIDLRNLKQTSTVQDYQEKFEDLACMVDWTPKALIAAFVGGLKDEIQIDVRAERITDLKACFAKARAVEERLQKKQELYKQWRAPNPVKGREAPQRPKQLPAPTRKEDPKPVFRSRGSYEVTEGEPPLEVEVIDESEIVEELLPPEEVQPSPEGTIHMMNDPHEPDAMKVVGRVGNLDVLVLLDSGVTHNFVGEHIANRLGSIVEEQKALRILVANGDSLPCTRKCTEVELTLQKVPFKHKWVTRNGRPRHEVMIEWEGVDGGTSWELFDKIKTQFPTGAWGQAPSQEGGSDTGQPSTWPRAATDVAKSSRQGRKRAARHLDRDEPSSIDPGAGQGDGEGGVLQLGSAGVRQLGVVTEGGAGGSATALSEAMEFQGGGSSSSVFKPTQAVFEPEPAGLVTGGHQPAPASSGRLCHYSGQLSGEHTSWSRASPACYLELLGITGGLNLSPAHFLDVPSLPAISGDLRPPLPFFR